MNENESRRGDQPQNVSEFDRQQLSDLFIATTRFEHAAVRPLYLLNGGAIIAAIAFAASQPEAAPWLIAPVNSWIVGLILAVATTACGHVSQSLFYKAQGSHLRKESKDGEKYEKRASNARRVAYVIGLLSVGCFAAGAFASMEAFANLVPVETEYGISSAHHSAQSETLIS